MDLIKWTVEITQQTSWPCICGGGAAFLLSPYALFTPLCHFLVTHCARRSEHMMSFPPSEEDDPPEIGFRL